MGHRRDPSGTGEMKTATEGSKTKGGSAAALTQILMYPFCSHLPSSFFVPTGYSDIGKAGTGPASTKSRPVPNRNDSQACRKGRRVFSSVRAMAAFKLLKPRSLNPTMRISALPCRVISIDVALKMPMPIGPPPLREIEPLGPLEWPAAYVPPDLH